MPRYENPAYLRKPTPDLKLVLTAIRRVLAGRPIHHDYLPDISNAIKDVVRLHHVSIMHAPKGVKDTRRAFYRISIQGPRVDGAWNFTPGHVMKLVEGIEDDDATEK